MRLSHSGLILVTDGCALGRGQAEEGEASNDGGLHGGGDGLELDLGRLRTDARPIRTEAFYRFFATTDVADV